MGREFLRRTGRELFMAPCLDTHRVLVDAYAARACRPAYRLLFRDDGMGAAHAHPATIYRGVQGISLAPRSPGLSSRRFLARILPQIRGIQPTAQENAARLTLHRISAGASYRLKGRRGTEESARPAASRPVQ